MFGPCHHPHLNLVLIIVSVDTIDCISSSSSSLTKIEDGSLLPSQNTIIESEDDQSELLHKYSDGIMRVISSALLVAKLPNKNADEVNLRYL